MYNDFHAMPRSEPEDQVRDAIVIFLQQRRITKIGNIQRSLQKKFPDTYRKGGNLTQIHRHLHKLMDSGIIDYKTLKGESWYWLTPKGQEYLLSVAMLKVRSVEREFSELREIDEGYKQEHLLREID